MSNDRNELNVSERAPNRFEHFWYLLKFAFQALFTDPKDSSYYAMSGQSKQLSGGTFHLSTHGYTSGSPITLTIMLEHLQRGHAANLKKAGVPHLLALKTKELGNADDIDVEALKEALASAAGLSEPKGPSVH